MRKKQYHLLSFLIAFLISATTQAQEIVVKSMICIPSDVTANMSENLHKDKKGISGGLVKVRITASNVNFSGNEILESKQYQTGEYWVFMANKANKLTIQTEDCPAATIDFRDYDCVVSSLMTYVLTLQIQDHSDKSGKLFIDFTPVDAEVLIDGKKVGGTPNIFGQLAVGQHDVAIRKNGYETYTTNLTLSANEQIDLTGTLPPAQPLSFTIDGYTFNMIRVEGGTFMMGGTDEQGADVEDREVPVHQVTLSDYYIGETMVTEGLWAAVMGKNNYERDNGKYDEYAVESVTWNDCQEFIKKLNEKTGQRFRLPSEAEWEFAARGGIWSKGTKYAGSNNMDEVGWHYNNTSQQKAIKQKKPNELGLYDMSGTMGEWCQDRYGKYSSQKQTNPQGAKMGSDRVVRGGSWMHKPASCRVSKRFYMNQKIHDNGTGFRLVM